MAEIPLQPTPPSVNAVCERLHQIAEGLHSGSVEELGTGRPVNQNVAEAIQAIENLRSELQRSADAHADAPLDREVDQDRMERAVSELDSDEFDMQG